jgi:hypothetical protein
VQPTAVAAAIVPGSYDSLLLPPFSTLGFQLIRFIKTYSPRHRHTTTSSELLHPKPRNVRALVLISRPLPH